MSFEDFSSQMPEGFWDKLSDAEKETLFELQKTIRKRSKSQQNHNSSLSSDLVQINNFVMSPPESTREAKAVCSGLIFFNNSILLNTKQAKIILGRCKSGINTSLQKLGYGSTKSGLKKNILTILPSLEEYPEIARQWTTRTIGKQNTKEKNVKLAPVPQITQQIEEIEAPEEGKQRYTMKQKHHKSHGHQMSTAQYQQQIQQYQMQQMQLQMQQMQQRAMPPQPMISQQFMQPMYNQSQAQAGAMTQGTLPINEPITSMTMAMMKPVDVMAEAVRPTYLPASMTIHISQNFRFFIPKTETDKELIFAGPTSSMF